MSDRRQINLIPEGRRLQIPVNWDYVLLAVLVVVVSVVSVQFVEGISKRKKLSKKVAAMKSERNELLKRIKELKGRSSMVENEKEQETLVKEIIGKRMGWEDIFKELGFITPSEAWLTDFLAMSTGGKVKVAMRGAASSQAQMAQFYSAIEKSEHFRDVLLISSEISKSVTPPYFEFYFAAPGAEIKSAEGDQASKEPGVKSLARKALGI